MPGMLCRALTAVLVLVAATAVNSALNAFDSRLQARQLR